MTALALKYRPRTFADVAGQKLAVVPLYRMARQGTLPPALLLAGEHGCGKTSTARILGAALNCESDVREADHWPCGKCPSCEAVAAGNSLDVIEVDAASNGGIDAIRKLQDLAMYGSPGAWKVVMLDEALALDTPLPTPGGWTTVEKVQVGDRLIGKDGRPVRVLRKTEVFHGMKCYRVHFKDGTSVVASANHKWLTKRGWQGRGNPNGGNLKVRTTEEMSGLKARLAIPHSPSWELPVKRLPVHPYLLGLWLGDGSTGQPNINGEVIDLEFYRERLAELHIPSRVVPSGIGRTAGRLYLSSRFGSRRGKGSKASQALLALPCYRSKYVPSEYLRGSQAQREALLRGLMDTDGSVDKTGFCTFTGNDDLSGAVLELLRSLGQTATRYWKPDTRSNDGGYYHVCFQPRHGLIPFGLPWKASRVRQAVTEVDWVGIRSIERVESVPVQCLEVDAEDHLFLAGEGCAVTHNCHAMTRDGFNALLKMLEEPPEHTLFVLLTTEPGKILGTVASRCMTFTFRRIPVADITARLAHICALERIDAEPALLAEIAGRAEGSMRDAVMALDQAASTLAVEGLTADNFEKVFGSGDYVLPLVEAAAAGNFPGLCAALEDALAQAGDPAAVIGKITGLLADLLVLRSGGQISAQGAALEARKALAARLDVPRLTKAMKVLWDYQTRVRVEDRRAGLKLAAVMVAEALCPLRSQAPSASVHGAVNGNGHHETSMDELREALGAT